ncbi:hypothetical protein H0H87_004171 [Tephrocybe sp. NHM501043]|nr:hypothetical protein H0H87_004171 [Tephrocybe sp. NHM501043]
MLQTRKFRSHHNREQESNQSPITHPFQDVADRYTSLPHSARRPTPRPRHRPDPHETTRPSVRPALPSSLPLSSPLSTSSGLCTDQYGQLTTSNLGLEVVPIVTARAINADTSNNSDPFGFFAVEKRLKVLRAQRVKARSRAAAPTQIQTTRDDLVFPPTPPKRRHKRRAGVLPIFSRELDSEADSPPSSPSPSKPASGTGKERAADSNIPVREDGVEGLEPSTPITIKSNPKRRIAKRACNKLSSKPSFPTVATQSKSDICGDNVADVEKPMRNTRHKKKGKGKVKSSSGVDDRLKVSK